MKDLCKNGKLKTTPHISIMDNYETGQINSENKGGYRTRN
jgi:hypothetical protein